MAQQTSLSHKQRLAGVRRRSLYNQDGMAFRKGPYGRAVQLCLVGALYYALVRIGMEAAPYTLDVAAVWPAAGFAFAALRVWGLRMWPAVFIGGFVPIMLNNPPGAIVILAGADTCGALASVWLLNRFHGQDEFYNTPRGMAIFMCAALVLSLVSSAIGVGTLLTIGKINSQPAGVVWWTWFLSDLAGVVFTAPVITAWLRRGFSPKLQGAWWEQAVILAALLAAGWIVFGRQPFYGPKTYPMAFMLTPLLVWAAFRLGSRGFLTTLFISGVLPVTGALLQLGPFAAKPFPQSVLLLQSYLVIMGATVLTVHAVVKDRGRKIKALALTQDAAIHALASLAETRDSDTGRHLKRTQHYVRILAEQLQSANGNASRLADQHIALMYTAAPLHDIGKVGVADAILLKPGRLNPEEFETMKKHALYGAKALRKAMEKYGPNEFVVIAEEIAYTHHEKWDGAGYPQGLKGEDIPLSGRLMALADVYDALTSKRVYKDSQRHMEAKQIIVNGMGEQFDPEVVKAFLRREHEFVRIAWKYADERTKSESRDCGARGKTA